MVVMISGPHRTCHNCTLENPRQITQCGACGSVNHRALGEQASKQEQSTWSMSNTTFGAVAGAVAGGLIGAVTRQGVVGGALRGGLIGGSAGARVTLDTMEVGAGCAALRTARTSVLVGSIIICKCIGFELLTGVCWAMVGVRWARRARTWGLMKSFSNGVQAGAG